MNLTNVLEVPMFAMYILLEQSIKGYNVDEKMVKSNSAQDEKNLLAFCKLSSDIQFKSDCLCEFHSN